MMPSFQDFDANGDGQLTQTEFEQARAQRIAERSQQGYQMRGLASAPSFADMDTNNDGVMDPDEFEAAQARHRGAAAPGTGQ
ncbi:EF-hand domain-containing protein [Rhabdochromatium marinum]|uniref:EF-hand domain-containing protein n=1 Tax=Rhabdochromatium marinum TaxID=48729 RepID=UPI001F5B4973|nr:EF-hand domain-containing protein [Rhabdochromatium marinum]